MKEIQPDTHLCQAGEPPSPKQATALTSAPASSNTHISTPINTTEPVSQVAADTCNRGTPATKFSEEAVKEIFSEDEGLSSLGVKLINLLHTIQKKANLVHRLHLFVETDRGFAGGITEGQEEVMHRVQTRIAFSPTVRSSDPQQQKGLSKLYSELTNISFQNAPTGSSYLPVIKPSSGQTASRDPRSKIPQRTLPFQTEIPQTVPKIQGHNGELRWPESITKEFHKHFPNWCPFAPQSGESWYTTAPQNSRDHHLLLEKDIVDRFRFLKEFQVMWIYQELFLYMHRQGRTLEKYGRVSGMAKSITYSQFTPPWIRLKLVVKAENTATNDTEIESFSEIVILTKAGVTDLRKERNMQGYRRLRFILAAFYSQEKESIRPLIDYLLTVAPESPPPPKQRRKPKKKKQREMDESVNNDSTTNNSTVETPRKKARLAVRSNADEVQLPARPERNDTELPQARENHVDAVQQAETLQSPPEPAMSVNLNSSSNFPVTEKSTSIVTEKPREKVLERNILTATEEPESVTGKQCSRLSPANYPLPRRQNRKSVFSDRTKMISDGKPASEEPSDVLTSTKNKTNNEERRLNSGQVHPITQMQSEQSAPDDQSTPFSEELDFSIHEHSDDSNDELERNPFSGVIKCGALAQCHWVLNLDMQDPQKMKNRCTKCQVPMHARCFALRRSVCTVCTKKAIFEKIYEEERQINS